jgi:hypothetical protein
MGFEVFGMGFAADAPMTAAETLYITGGAFANIGMGGSMMGKISFPSLTVGRVGSVTGWPELTGTGDAQLWAFSPDTMPPQVAQLDKASGATVGTPFTQPSIMGQPSAWAFAFWGDGFWIFLKGQNLGDSTSVYHVRRSDGMFSTVLSNTGRSIVGAGVSTCAPIVGVQR